MFNSNCSPGLDRLRTIKFYKSGCLRDSSGGYSHCPCVVFRLCLLLWTEARAETDEGLLEGGRGRQRTGIHRRGPNVTAWCRAMDQWQIKQTVPQKD